MMDDRIKVCIMAGGIGSRFWPKSRNSFPKQFIDILGTGSSLLQATFNRFNSLIDAKNIFVVTNREYFELVTTQLPELPEENIICEPSRNNTAPSIAFTAFKLQKDEANAIMVVVPSDHLILRESEYLKIIQSAVEYCKKDNRLITLGIVPTRPDIGYGYIQTGVNLDGTLHSVEAFHEKPELKLAESYLKDENYLWNAGMFIWKVKDILEAFKIHAPDIHSLFYKGSALFNTDNEAAFIDSVYSTAPNISIDHAIMEKAENIYIIRADIGWSDLGTWNSVYETNKDVDLANVIIGPISSNVTDTHECIISMKEDKMLVLDGLKGYIIVDSDDVLMIYPKNKEQDIKKLTQELKEKELFQYL